MIFFKLYQLGYVHCIYFRFIYSDFCIPTFALVIKVERRKSVKYFNYQKYKISQGIYI